MNDMELINDSLSDDNNQVGHGTLNYSDIDKNESLGHTKPGH